MPHEELEVRMDKRLLQRRREGSIVEGGKGGALYFNKHHKRFNYDESTRFGLQPKTSRLSVILLKPKEF